MIGVLPFALQLIQGGYIFEDASAFINNYSAWTHKNQTIFISNRLHLDIVQLSYFFNKTGKYSHLDPKPKDIFSSKWELII